MQTSGLHGEQRAVHPLIQGSPLRSRTAWRAGGGAYLHGKCLAAAGVITCEGALLLVEGENMALEVEHSCVGPAAAFSGTSTHCPFRGMSFHVLLEVIFALKCFLAYFTRYLL